MEKHTLWTSFFFFILMQNYQKIKTSLICPFSFYLEHIGFWKAINWKTISLNKNCIFNKFDSRMQHFWVKGYSDSMPEMMELIFGLFVASIFEKDTFWIYFQVEATRLLDGHCTEFCILQTLVLLIEVQFFENQKNFFHGNHILRILFIKFK